MTDVFAIQDEIAAAVVDALKMTLLGEVPHARVTDPAAYALYLQSKVASNKRSKEGFEEAVAMLTQALAIDPEYAAAWVELGTVQTNQTGSGFVPETEGFARARASAERALAIDPDNARAISNLGWLAMYAEWDFAKAADLFARARRLEPGNASILNAYAVLHGVFGRRDSMVSLYQEALTVDPLAMSVLNNLGGAYYGRSRLQEMGEIVARVRQIDAESDASKWLAGLHHLAAGESEASLDQFRALGGVFGAMGAALASYDLGRDAESDEHLQFLVDAGDTTLQVAVVHAYRQDFDTAFDWLDRAYDEHDDELIEIRMYQPFDPMHGDPRWEALLEKVGISDNDARRAGL